MPTATLTNPAGPDTDLASDPRVELARIGRRWSVCLIGLVHNSARLHRSGHWAHDGSPTCAHWIANNLDVELATAREWIRIGTALRTLPAISGAFNRGELNFTKTRMLTRIATADHDTELCELAVRTPGRLLNIALAAWLARNEDPDQRHHRHQQVRAMRWRLEPDGMVTANLAMTPEQAMAVTPAVDQHVMRTTPTSTITLRENRATGLCEAHREWPTLAQQRIDALVALLTNGGTSTSTEIILHVRADGCTLDDGTPIPGTVVERIANTAALRAMIHDAESKAINVSGRHRHHTKRQKLVVKERDRTCIDCGATALLQYDHVPDFEQSRRTLVDETELRCSACHANRHARERAMGGKLAAP